MNINMNEIRKKSLDILKDRGVPYHPHLPLLDENLELRSKEDVCNRVLIDYAIFALANGGGSKFYSSWLQENAVLELLTEDEKKLFKGKLDKTSKNEAFWRLQTLYTYCWIGKIIDHFSWPGSGVDYHEMFEYIPEEISVKSFKKKFKFRDIKEIVQQLDVYYNMHASLIHHELWTDKKQLEAYEIGVFIERRLALEWVLSSLSIEDISLDT